MSSTEYIDLLYQIVLIVWLFKMYGARLNAGSVYK